jgi:aspartyl-tRNA(Asn)/glutamyl-tRNA(Gln) amidotransferase subunit C
MISAKEVKHIVKLARLRLAEKEIRKLQKDLTTILAYVKKLEELNTEKTLPTSHPTRLENVTRQDGSKTRELGEVNDLIKMAPESKESYVKTKRILLN